MTETSSKRARTVGRGEALPTAIEQRQLHNFEILTKSNLLNLQSEELVNEIDRSTNEVIKKKKVDKWLKTLKDHIIDQSKFTCHDRELTISYVKKQSYKGLSSVFHKLHSEELSITYKSPTSVEVTGSFALESIVTPFTTIDILVKMPQEMFHHRL